MLISVLFSTLLRVTGKASYSSNLVYVADFGYYAGGILNFSWTSLPDDRPFDVELLVFHEDELSDWIASSYDPYKWPDCDIPTPTYANWTTQLTSESQRRVFEINATDVYVALIRHCTKGMKGVYGVDAEFVNPGGQQLDTREIPALTVLLVMIPLFCALLVFWIAWVWFKRAGFQRIHVYLAGIIFAYVIFLIFHRMSLYYAQYNGDATGWVIVRFVFEGIYDVILFTVLMMCSSGWCVLAVELTWQAVLLTFVGVSAFVTSCFLQLYLSLGIWQIAVLILQMASLAAIFTALYMNTRKAQQIIKAHLLVIREGGIAPATTPVYHKFLIYQAILYLIGLAFLAFLILNIFLSAVSADQWVVWLVNNFVQILTIGMMLWLYRPRGTAVDQFMRPDAPAEGAERGEVLLEDLEGFTVDGGGAEMRDWEEGMELPLQPLVVSSKERKNKQGGEQLYAPIATEHDAD
jgi:hypothetical protein